MGSMAVVDFLLVRKRIPNPFVSSFSSSPPTSHSNKLAPFEFPLVTTYLIPALFRARLTSSAMARVVLEE